LQQSDELKTFKGLITFAKKQRLKSVKFNGFEFDLTGFDPTEKRFKAIEAELARLKEIVEKIKLKLDWGK